MTGLRVVDAGRVNALRSQALWHGIAQTMTPQTAPTLSLCQPGSPYVGLGYHRPLDEIDLATCQRLSLPVIRRQIGGGPVYIDSDQLFFQITLPAAQAPRRVDRLYERLLAPAVEAFRTLGLNARIRGLNDIAIEDRRLSGTGAGRIANGVTVVGNAIFEFRHRRMAEVLALPTESMRRECLRLMEKHVTSFAAEGLERLTMRDARTALIDAYSHGLGLTAEAGELSSREIAAVECWERRFESQDWLEGPDSATESRPGRQVKISADIWCYVATRDELEVQASFRDGKVERLCVTNPQLNGAGKEIERRLAGCPIADLARRLAPFGHQGDRVLELLEAGAALR
ncbi:MAG: lipoate--protein ligase family protein [bacterium]|nr:lipoate--protein ligase family protein [bacterium]